MRGSRGIPENDERNEGTARRPLVGEGATRAPIVIAREEAERILGEQDRKELARMAYREALAHEAVYLGGQAVLDLSTGEVRPSAYAEGHADDPGFEHLVPLMGCEAELKERLSEEEFVRLARNGRRPGAEEIAERLDALYGGPRRAFARPFERSEGSLPT